MKLERIREPLLEKWMKSLAKHPSSPVFPPLWMVLVIPIILCLGWSMVWTPRSFAHSLSTLSSPFDFGNQTIEINHAGLHFTNGFYKSPDGQHTASITDRRVNLSITKAAAILIDNPSGSGIFSYLVGAARADGKERYSAPVFLGDRIKIEAVSIGEKTVTVSYLTHPANVPLATLPTESVIVIYTFQDDGNLQAAL